MEKQFHPHFIKGCDYFSMLVLKLNHVSKRDPGRHHGGREGWGKGLGGSRRVGWGVGRWGDICNHQGYVRQHIARDQIVHVFLWFVTGRIYPHSSGLRHLH